MVSVIIPIYKVERYLRKCIDSVLNQTFNDYEIIVVDDLSTDNSVEVVKGKLRKQDKLIKNKSKRLNGGSRNEAIIRAKGEYLIFIDSDDWFIDDKVFEDIDRKLNGEDILFTGYMTHSRESDLLVNNTVVSLEEALRSPTCAIWTKVVKREVMELFPEGTLFEDRIQHYKLLLKAKTFTNLGRATIMWNRTNSNSVSISKEHIWWTYQFNYAGELFRLINNIPDGEFKNYVREELKGYMNQIKDMVDKI